MSLTCVGEPRSAPILRVYTCWGLLEWGLTFCLDAVCHPLLQASMHGAGSVGASALTVASPFPFAFGSARPHKLGTEDTQETLMEMSDDEDAKVPAIPIYEHSQRLSTAWARDMMSEFSISIAQANAKGQDRWLVYEGGEYMCLQACLDACLDVCPLASSKALCPRAHSRWHMRGSGGAGDPLGGALRAGVCVGWTPDGQGGQHRARPSRGPLQDRLRADRPVAR